MCTHDRSQVRLSRGEAALASRQGESPLIAAWKIPAVPTAVRSARGEVRRQLQRWGLDEMTFTTELIVSELVTNAVRHAAGPVVLRLVHASRLTCEVTDASPELPHLHDPEPGADHGRGLLLVAHLADQWGARRTVTGKTVWAQQSLDEVGRQPA